MAAVDAHGQVLNEYRPGADRRIDGVEPDRPWAVYLAGTDHRFRLLAFDLDAKTDAAAAQRDAQLLAGLLADAGLPAVVCQSGPSGGRHVWVGLAESVDPETVATLARLARHLCPTLDLAPLTNPVTGCVRPPGAPHRAGGHSTVLSGRLDTLTQPTGTAAQVRQLVETLAQLVTDAEPAQAIDPRTPLPLDHHGRLYLPGPRRPLPRVSAAALDEDAASGDASAVLWRVLIGAAAARWRHADIAALADTAPGLEHVRTYRDRSTRRPRGRREAASVLARQWDKAVKYVASADRQIGDDPTFDARADAIAARVRAVQTRADAAAGRWTRGGGPADRRVLDVLCVLALQAVSAAVEADTRRLALLAGIGRETARTALLRLAEDGWIAQTRPADGPHGAHWTIDPQNTIHRDAGNARSQAVTRRPAGAGAAWRALLLDQLTSRVNAARHDAFTPGGLGLHAGNTYARITSPMSTTDVARTCAQHPDTARATLDRLFQHGLLNRTSLGWAPIDGDPRAGVADELGVMGTLDDRAARYGIEREVWAWWLAEHKWMTAAGRHHRRRRPTLTQPALPLGNPWDQFPAYPRTRRRADHRAATEAVRAGLVGAAATTWRTPA